MSRYIDVNAFKTWIDEYVSVFKKSDKAEIKGYISHQPSIEIIRCGECQRVREYGGHANCNGYLYCRKWKTPVDEDGFCSWGERDSE